MVSSRAGTPLPTNGTSRGRAEEVFLDARDHIASHRAPGVVAEHLLDARNGGLLGRSRLHIPPLSPDVQPFTPTTGSRPASFPSLAAITRAERGSTNNGQRAMCVSFLDVLP